MKFIKSLAFSFVFLFAYLIINSGSSLQALELIYPEDGTFVVRSDFIIIKGGDTPPIENIVVEINGLKSGLINISSPEYRAVFDDFLILEPELSSGLNEIKIHAFVKEKNVSSVAANVYFMDNPYGVPPEGFRPYVMHIPQREMLCSPCHNMNPGIDQLKKTAASENPCGECHSRILNKKYVHGPAGVFSCIYCHDPDSKPSKYMSSGGDVDTCQKCHSDKIEFFNKSKNIHGPLMVGLCSICHDSHSSDNPAQLHAPVNDICISCHAGVDLQKHVVRGVQRPHPLGGVPDPQKPGKEMSCASCHNPHGGANRFFFASDVASSSMMLCQKCHKK